MLRLRATLTSHAVLHLRQEQCLAHRGGAVAVKAVGRSFLIRPTTAQTMAAAASLSSVRTLSTVGPSRNASSPLSVSAAPGAVRGMSGMLRGAAAKMGNSGAYTYLCWPGQRPCLQQPQRGMHTRGKEKNGDGSATTEEKTEEEDKSKAEEETSKNKAEGEKTAEEEETSGTGKKKKKPQPKKGRSIKDNYKAFKEDIGKFPDIYNSANAINFVVFTVFCLCSTGSNAEEQWWMREWGLDNLFRPWNWLLHTFLTNNFLSMTYAMMLLHTLCHMVLPSLGSKGLFTYFAAAAVISGAIMWAGNRLYYGAGVAAEKQFGPWDTVSALFVLAYLMYGVTPVAVLNSFNSWIKYACWVGEICILYFDWQPTLVGAVVGVALCKGHPALRALIAKGGVK